MYLRQMKEKFSVILLQEAKDFLASLDKKTRKKILYNMWISKLQNDISLFKPLEREIWEFRTFFNKRYIRLFSFWDKSDNQNTLVVATHGLIKKTPKIPKSEINKAVNIREKYFKEKKSIDENI